MSFSYDGFAPWKPDDEIIECVVNNDHIDMHNSCTLDEVRVANAPSMTIAFVFSIDSDPRRFRLVFGDVTSLVFNQDDRAATRTGAYWSPRTVSTFEAFGLRIGEKGLGIVEARTITGCWRYVSANVVFEFI